MAHRFVNIDGTALRKSLGELFRWQVLDRFAGKKRIEQTPTFPGVLDSRKVWQNGRPQVVWIGHASFLMRLNHRTIVIDPVWSETIHGVRRLVPPGLSLEDAGPIHLALISHAHMDHLDLRTIRRIGPDCTYVVPTGVGSLLRRIGMRKVHELGWWDSDSFDQMRITLVPAYHWSFRTPFDYNRALWGGFVIESEHGVCFHAGDTGFHQKVFCEIALKMPHIDWAMLPIGAYEPSWMMREQHMNPEEAGMAFELLGAKHFLAMHWGTFHLTDEPIGEPPMRIASYFHRRSIALNRLHVMQIGESYDIGSASPLHAVHGT